MLYGNETWAVKRCQKTEVCKIEHGGVDLQCYSEKTQQGVKKQVQEWETVLNVTSMCGNAAE